MTERSRLGRAFLVVAGAVALYFLVAVLTGWGEITARLAGFPRDLIAPLVGLSLLNYALRFWRWELYLRAIGARTRRRESLSLFVATFAMAITPGKIGEVYKAAYLWEKHRVPLSRGLPVLVAERVFDLLAILFLAACGLLYWEGPLAAVRAALIVGAGVPLALWALRSRRVQRLVVTRAAQAHWSRDRSVAIDDALACLRRLTAPGLAAASLGLSVTAWFAECVSLRLVCEGLGAPLGTGQAVFVYAAATLAGSLVFLPGGLGGTEGTIVFLLHGLGMDMETSVSAALIVRLSTLWLAVGLGFATFLVARRQFLAPSAPAPAPDAAPVSGPSR